MFRQLFLHLGEPSFSFLVWEGVDWVAEVEVEATGFHSNTAPMDSYCDHQGFVAFVTYCRKRSFPCA